ncbi:cytochrome P450 [Actinophytocola gossypii]|uniref:Cytochrome P450 n=1 Tax=Actinophytocola gossypii TaxID=2812003 RepID=A0ABT2JCI1_9PSEU|nr:cytochrome P450 [Actinophytocola gossypii]MCT2585274.1 cytochrome P450 [Actinophytocola gossypii]
MSTLETTNTTLPPGPRLPSLVQTLLFLVARRQTHQHLQRRFGDVFTTRITGRQMLVTLADPEHIREVFAGSPTVFHAGQGNSILRPVMGKHSVLVTDEDEHQRARKLLMPAFNGAALRGYGDMMASLAAADAEAWPVGRPFAVHRRMNAVTLEIILRVVFGLGEGARLTDLRPRLRRISDIGPLTVLGWNYPNLGRYGPWRRNRENLRDVDRLLYAEIADRRGAGDLADRGDVLSRLLTAGGGDLADAEVRDQMITLLLAGHETTATALAWSFHELARRPAVQRRAQRAADDGDEDYLQAVAKESMRRRPVVQNVARALTEPTEVAGYLLPAGTIVGPSILLVHRNPGLHEDPVDFRPERFVGRGPEAGTWIPFGGGVRRCLGAGFSLREAGAVLREVLIRYDLRPDRARPEFPKPRNVTLVPARGARIIATPRSQA